MSPRALAAAAVLTAALVGPAQGQTSAGFARVGSEPAPIGAPAGPAASVGNPYFTGGPSGDPLVVPMNARPVIAAQPTAPPIPPTGATVAPPTTSGPILATDDLIGPYGLRGPQCWVGAEYLLWWLKDSPLPIPIAMIGPAASLGIIGQPGVVTAIGNTQFEFHDGSGVRVNGGWWFTPAVGIESSFFIVPEQRTSTPALVGTPGLPTLSRPFFDTALNRQNSRLLTRPDTFAGGIQAEASTELWGIETIPVLRCFDRGGWLTIDAMSGFKFLSLEESLEINDFAAALQNGVANFNGQEFRQPAITFLNDRFATTNRFYGWVLGTRANAHYQAFTVSFTGKLGIGTMHQEVRIDGSSTLVGPYPAPQVTGGGFYSVGANAGKFERNEFAVVPEFGVNLSVQVTPLLTLTAGYNYLYISDVLRPGDQLNSRINSTLIPTGQNYGARFGPPSPGLPFNSSNYWAQGFNFGFAVGY